MKVENCKGCRTFMNTYVKCSPMLANKSSECPCITCLIKGVCNMACEEYEIFSSGFGYGVYKKEQI